METQDDAALIPPDDPRWLAFLEERTDALPFHHPSWSRAIAETYGLEPLVAALENDGRLLAGIPLMELSGQWLALPFTDRCPPLGDPGPAASLVSELDRLRDTNGISAIEIRAEVGGENAHVARRSLQHVLELDADPAVVFRGFSKSQMQRNVKRAEREGIVTVERATDRSGLTRDFYGLHRRTRRRLGKPIQSRSWFEQLWDHVLDRGLGFVAVARAQDTAAAAGVFLTWNRTVIYLYGASDETRWNLRANHLLFWDTIRWAAENGYAHFDFGRTNPENKGLRDFKAGWGAVESPLHYTLLADTAPTPGNGGRAQQLAEAVLRRLPDPLYGPLAERLHRHTA